MTKISMLHISGSRHFKCGKINATNTPITRYTEVVKKKSKPFVKILLAYDGHDFNRSSGDAVIDAIRPAQAAPVAFADIGNDLVQQGLFCDLLKTIEKGVVIVVSLRFPIRAKSAPLDAFQICFCIFAKPIVPHRGALHP